MSKGRDDLTRELNALMEQLAVLRYVSEQGYPRDAFLLAIRTIAIQTYDILEKWPRSTRSRTRIKLAWLEVARHVQLAGVRWGVGNGRDHH